MADFTRNTKVKIVESGRGCMKQFNIMTVDGSVLHSVYFDDYKLAKKYTEKKGYVV